MSRKDLRRLTLSRPARVHLGTLSMTRSGWLASAKSGARFFVRRMVACINASVAAPSYAAGIAGLMVKKPTANTIYGFITGVSSGGSNEMWFIGIVIIVLLLGPLRPWVGRHWALLISVTAGAMFGWILGTIVIAQSGTPPFMALLWSVVAAIAFGGSCPAWLRKLAGDGRDEQSSRRH